MKLFGTCRVHGVRLREQTAAEEIMSADSETTNTVEGILLLFRAAFECPTGGHECFEDWLFDVDRSEP